MLLERNRGQPVGFMTARPAGQVAPIPSIPLLERNLLMLRLMKVRTAVSPVVSFWMVASVFSALDPAGAAEAGAWETFSTQSNADAWTVYNYADQGLYFPTWQANPAGFEYIYFGHDGDEPLWIFADTISNIGGGAMIGDFASEKVQGILVDVLIDSLADFDQLDCVISVRNAQNTLVSYFSDSFFDVSFSGDGWYSLRFGFEETWYEFTGSSWVPVALTPANLAAVEEIGFRFFPKVGTTAPVVAAIDDVRLEPLVVAPALGVSTTATDFRLAFTPAKANSCAIEKLETTPTLTWEDVIGETDITGPGEHVYTTPLAVRGIYRVQSIADYTPVVTP